MGDTIQYFECNAMLAVFPFLMLSVLGSSQVQRDKPAPARNDAIVELFEDDADALLKLLTNPGDAPGQGDVESAIVFSGKKSLKITQYQRFNRALPGWRYVIREKPKEGEYRYLRFAWTSDQSTCLMLQLHDATDWHIRYTAGQNRYGWATRFVADKAPTKWNLVTVDLFKDFGDRTLTGIAFTIHGGSGYFDHVYLGRTIDDLDRIDANGLTKKKVKLEIDDLNRCWRDLGSDDASEQYRAFWTLVAGDNKSAAFLQSKLAPAKTTESDNKQIREWIRQLDSGVFSVRAKANNELKKRLDIALPLLEAELPRATSTEMRQRLEALIALAPRRDQDQVRRKATSRILDYITKR